MPTSTEAALAGIRGRCMACGKGRLFAGYLRLADRCPACGADFSMADIGDGAAVLVILAVGALVVPVAFGVEIALHWPPWAAAVIAGALTILFSLLLLPVVKGVLFTMQWTHRAGEGRRE